MTSIEFYQTPLRATKMAPLRGSYSPSNALAGYQNGTAMRFLFPFKRPCGLPKWHRYAVLIEILWPHTLAQDACRPPGQSRGRGRENDLGVML